MSIFPISDVVLLPLEKSDRDGLVLLSENHHILRRFGQLEIRRLTAGPVTSFTRRAIADEVWIPLDGEITFLLQDQRPASPSAEQTMEITIHAGQPQALLIPFGVAFAVKVETPSQTIRLTTHADDAGDETQPAESLLHLWQNP